MQEEKIHQGIADLEHALIYCQNNYSSCAEQRLSTFRYFIIYIAALAYGFYEIHEHEKHLNAYVIVIILASLCISFAFYQLESRNRQILNVSEEGCKEIETLLSGVLKEELLLEVTLSTKNPNKENENDKTYNSHLKKIKELIERFDESKIKVMTNCEIKRPKGMCGFFNSYKNSIKLVFLVVFLFHIFLLMTVISCMWWPEEFSKLCPKNYPNMEKKEYFFIEEIEK